MYNGSISFIGIILLQWVYLSLVSQTDLQQYKLVDKYHIVLKNSFDIDYHGTWYRVFTIIS